MTKKQILAEILEERHKQDVQWGGPAHDRQHSMQDWVAFIDRQLFSADVADNYELYRQRMIKIAALSLATIEALDEINLKR